MAIFNLGGGTDNITGTAGDDEFRARGNTLSANDVLVGGDGFDTFKVTRADLGAIDFTKPGVSVTGFERLLGSNTIAVDSGNDVFILNETIFSQFVQIDGLTGSDELILRGTNSTSVFDLTGVTMSNIEILDIDNGRLVLNSTIWDAIAAGTITIQGGDNSTLVVPGVVTLDDLAARTNADILAVLTNGVFGGTVEFQVSVSAPGVPATIATRTATLNSLGQYVETTVDPNGVVLGSFSWQSFTRTLDITNPASPVLLSSDVLQDDGTRQITTFAGGVRSKFEWLDQSDVFDWDQKVTDYNGVGAELFRRTVFDDGTGSVVARQSGLNIEGRNGAVDDLFGTAGADTFVFRTGSGADKISAFQRTLDTLDLSNTGIADLASLLTHASAGIGAQTIINLGGGDVLTIGGITVANLQQIDAAGRITYDGGGLI